jgi:hypothetical protein
MPDSFAFLLDDRTLHLTPWTEIVGRVEKIDDKSVTITCHKKFRIIIPSDVLKTLRNLVRKGNRIGILMLDDGTMKVRLVHGKS